MTSCIAGSKGPGHSPPCEGTADSFLKGAAPSPSIDADNPSVSCVQSVYRWCVQPL